MFLKRYAYIRLYMKRQDLGQSPSGVATGGGQGGRVPPPDSEKIAKNRKKGGISGKKRKNRKEKAHSTWFFLTVLKRVPLSVKV